MIRQTIILLFITTLSCNAQDTLIYYPPDYADSLKYESSKCDSNLIQCQEFIKSLVEVMENPELYGDTEVIIYDSINTIRLKKEGGNSWYEISEGTKRYEFWIVDNILQVWIGDSLNAKLLLHYELK